ncbi:hypothetical protein NP233_g10547 [Leucocoprinus birnbaumii]|uniref:Methyltransferase domain-containing protein n=1 Tax=Leucocoprinus birnbaumii TaxID=56174 RepID=A0AAD5VKJ2_9AGAR|nr:hypothetical protein NP233_g10547 [Leucocoprinus birnbaumii]
MATVEVLPAVSVDEKPKRYYIFESEEVHKYLLPADEEERVRLDEQSLGIIQAFDNKLIWAPITLKEGDAVLDSGTGSGHWLLSLAKELEAQKIPSIRLLGSDITPRMFPPPSLIPHNASFSTDSITELPASWSGTISLIHQRLLFLALQEPQWKTALSEMYRVLTPGGCIQLFELNYRGFDSPNEALKTHKAFQFRNRLGEVRKVVVDIVDHLEGWIKEAGFVDGSEGDQ